MRGAVAVARVAGMSGATAAHETHSTEEAAVHHMPTPGEANTADNAKDGLYELYHKHQEERKVNQAQNEQDCVCNPLGRP